MPERNEAQATPRLRAPGLGMLAEARGILEFNQPAAGWAIADRLAQGEREFRPFDRSGPFAIAYAPPEQAQSDR